MAPESKGKDESPGTPEAARARTDSDGKPEHDGSKSEEHDDEEDEEEEEPQLKYASLTKAQGALYRNGDAASAFLVAGDKMVSSFCSHVAGQ